MKQWFVGLMALGLAALCGCSPMLNNEYVSITPHVLEAADDDDILVAESYLSLENCLLELVENVVTDGVIRVYDYTGNLEEDLETAVESVVEHDPLGNYALQSMDYEVAFVVSYYEVKVSLVYRRNQTQIESIERLQSTSLEGRIIEALENLETEVVVRESFYVNTNIQAIADAYYDSFPAICVEKPKVSVRVYPDSGYVRTVEILFNYDHTYEELIDIRTDVGTSLRSAEEYVRYRKEQTAKLDLLYGFFTQRFAYGGGDTSTPVYSFLCRGIITEEGAAKSLDMICKQIGIESYVVKGEKNGESYVWNILNLDGTYYHVDLEGAITAKLEELPLFSDDMMEGYRWDAEKYPACPGKKDLTITEDVL